MRVLRVKVKPNSKKQAIQTAEDGSLIISLKSPPVDGKANEELIKLLANKFDVAKSKIQIKSGFSSRQKLVEIQDS
ncbi:MAG: YggU family protein [Cyanobacteria bacterium CRU_2_1]|nr:YggU family protein [Cyanobacteria bacterium RU_5_0]NJR59219.1 YggU family protein [Cyanobacteria bacterium CRU_2_1]